MSLPIHCILFDLDGTLLDTSYDFSYALNQTCRDFNAPPLRYQDLRKIVSQGGQAMTQLAFPTLSGEALEIRKQHFLNVYFEHIDHHTQLFPGLESGLKTLAKKQIPWGIVTNKPTWLTEKLLQNIRFPSEPHSVVCGDTLTVNKPNPAPLHLAAKQCNIDSKHCLYIGDHRRDIEAGINAGMHTAGAMFGYLTDDDYENPWPTQLFFETPYDMSQYFQQLYAD
ncbi:MAG: HAD-IA family hydrolase [Thiomicrorhabdus sp.]|nr:HAD-IA family hydrolase [Thiomicrorhabdus sp.]